MTEKFDQFISGVFTGYKQGGFAIEVNSLMRGTQKTYKATGGLVVDIFNTIRYN